jgi:hypothetical protein
MKKIDIELTKKGHPALWEKGGGMSNTGYATIIAGVKGEKLTPAYVNRRGHLACGKHALFIIKEGYHIILSDHHRGDFEIEVYRITAINKEEKFADMELVCEYSQGEWNVEPQEFLHAAIDAAVEKSQDYHCRSPYYVLK